MKAYKNDKGDIVFITGEGAPVGVWAEIPMAEALATVQEKSAKFFKQMAERRTKG